MSNILEYAKRNLDTFEQRPFCPVDSLVLSSVAYMSIPSSLEEAYSWEGMRLADLYRAEHFDSYYAGIWAEQFGIQLLTVIAANPRFRDITVRGFRESIDQELQMQFSATTYSLSDGSHYVAYKGTDMSFVGWKEDFNLSFQCPVPSQKEAAAYLTEVASRFDGPLRIGGHSKGGNLAIFAAAQAEGAIQNRIKEIYSHDGPGFLPEFTQSANYRFIAPRIKKSIPQSSLIGMLMEQGDYAVVKSDARGIMQHSPATWIVEDCDFDYAEGLSNDARYADRTIDEWMYSKTPEEREAFVNALYSILSGINGVTVGDFKADWKTNVPAVAKAIAGMDPDTKAFTVATIGDLISIGARNFPELFGVHETPSLKHLSTLLALAKRDEA